jgi:hypothetical protein
VLPAVAAAFLASLPMSDTLWLTTAELCEHLAISRSTLFAIRRSGLLKEGRHLVAKNPTSVRSHLLWNCQRCEMALGRIS